ncbi:unnamed protein product [Urochloa humidicola]
MKGARKCGRDGRHLLGGQRRLRGVAGAGCMRHGLLPGAGCREARWGSRRDRRCVMRRAREVAQWGYDCPAAVPCRDGLSLTSSLADTSLSHLLPRSHLCAKKSGKGGSDTDKFLSEGSRWTTRGKGRGGQRLAQEVEGAAKRGGSCRWQPAQGPRRMARERGKGGAWVEWEGRADAAGARREELEKQQSALRLIASANTALRCSPSSSTS